MNFLANSNFNKTKKEPDNIKKGPRVNYNNMNKKYIIKLYGEDDVLIDEYKFEISFEFNTNDKNKVNKFNEEYLENDWAC